MEEIAKRDRLEQENEHLRRENARLRSTLEELRAKLAEPDEVIGAIRRGEIDALVVHEDGQEQIYSLQRFDSVYRSVVEECFPYGVFTEFHLPNMKHDLQNSAHVLKLIGQMLADANVDASLVQEVRQGLDREVSTITRLVETFQSMIDRSESGGAARKVRPR